MAEVDTSSYKYNTVNPLDVASKYNQLQSQNITIDKQKLELMNQKYGIMKKEIFSLANDPNATPESLVEKGQSLVKAGVLDAKDYAKFVQNIPKDPGQIQGYLKQVGSTLLDTQAAINFQYGTPGMVQTGAANVPVVQSPAFGTRQTGAPIQNQLGPESRETLEDVYDSETGRVVRVPRSQRIDSTGGQSTGPAVVAPVAPQVGTRLPVGPRQAPAERTALPGPSPEFEASRKALTDDQALASERALAIKPIVGILPQIEDLTTGIGTETFNKARAALVNLGIAGAEAEDATALYQELNKKLNAYIQNSPSSNRSDKALAQTQESNPDAKGQINKALVKLAQDAVAMDRINIAAPAFVKKQGTPEQYSENKSKFINSMDPIAFKFKEMGPKEKQAIADKYTTIKDGKRVPKDDAESKKFFRSLAIADSVMAGQ